MSLYTKRTVGLRSIKQMKEYIVYCFTRIGLSHGLNIANRNVIQLSWTELMTLSFVG